MGVAFLSYLEYTSSQLTSWFLTLTMFLASFSQCSRSLSYKDVIDVTTGVEYPTVSGSLHFDQLRIFDMFSLFHKEASLMSEE